MKLWVFALSLLAACQPTAEHPEPDAWTMAGPGGPQTSFQTAELFEGCSSLTGGETDHQEHNLVSMHNGYLLMPWAPEDGGGGISFYDYTDPCAPIKIGQAEDPVSYTHLTLPTKA